MVAARRARTGAQGHCHAAPESGSERPWPRRAWVDRAAVVVPSHLGRVRNGHGLVAPRSGSWRSRSRRIRVRRPNGCGRRCHQGGPRTGMGDSETKDDQTQVTQRR